MAGTYDNEQQRIIDRIKCIAFRESKDAGAEFINRKLISEKLGRSIAWVGQWLNRTTDECFVDFGHTGRPLKMPQESQAIFCEFHINNARVVMQLLVKFSNCEANEYQKQRFVDCGIEKDLYCKTIEDRNQYCGSSLALQFVNEVDRS
jgi:hypothetical protein